jgi:PAS domain S-box-containing protein
MSDQRKTKAELIDELKKLRRKVSRLEKKRSDGDAIKASRETKSLDELLLRRDAELHAVINSLPFDFFALDEQGRYFLQNDHCKKNWGDVTGKRPEDMNIDKKTLSLWMNNNRRAYSGETIKEEVSFTFKGEERHFYNVLSPIKLNEKVIGILGSNLDITEQKRAEKALRESEERFRMIIETEPECVKIIDHEERLVMMNPAGLRMIEAESLDQVRGQKVYPLVSPEYRNQFREMVKRVLDGEEGHLVFEITGLKGNRCWLETNSVPLRDASGTIIGLLGVTRDITRNKKAEEELIQSHERFKTIMDSIDSVVYVADMETYELLYLNEYSKKIFGDGVGKKCWQILQKDQNGPCDFCTNKYLLNDDGAPGKPYEWEFQNTQNGQWYLIKDSAVPWTDGRMVRFELATNITARKKLEEEMTKIKNIESLGILAGGLAHDFNNMLAGILGNISLSRMKVGNPDYISQKLADAEKISLKARDLTQQLLVFSRGGAPVFETLALDKIIRSSTAFAVNGSNVRCTYEIADGLWPVEVDASQIAQVFHNLALNAREAMGKGGTVEIRAENTVIHREDNIGDLVGGQYVKVSVKDEGAGIPNDVLPKIFDPYFSSKSMGADKGMGLGLSISYSVVKRHNGAILVEAGVDKGTIFTVYLPASVNDLQEDSKNEEIEVVEDLVRGRILVMDDDEAVRKTTGALLEAIGYDVITVKEGEDTIKAYSELQGTDREIDVVILDLTVAGGMGGAEAIKELQQIDPSIKAIITSGYTDNSIISHYRNYGFDAALIKPCKIEELTTAIQKLITNDSGSAALP